MYLMTSFHVSPTVRLIVAVRIEDQLPDRRAVLGDDPHAKAIDERQHPCPGEPSPESDVMQP
jgi:hypothetical protein